MTCQTEEASRESSVESAVVWTNDDETLTRVVCVER